MYTNLRNHLDDDMQGKSEAYRFLFGEEPVSIKPLITYEQRIKLQRKSSSSSAASSELKPTLSLSKCNDEDICKFEFTKTLARNQGDALFNLCSSPKNLPDHETGDHLYNKDLNCNFSDYGHDEPKYSNQSDFDCYDLEDEERSSCLHMINQVRKHCYFNTDDRPIEEEPHSVISKTSELNRRNNDYESSDLKALKKHSFTLRHRAPTSKSSSKSKFKWNAFSLGRTCFRGMSNYYKAKFETSFKKWVKILNKNKPTMEQLVTDFLKNEFKFNEAFYTSQRFPGFLDSMMTILHSQNYKKAEDYIVGRDFRVIRNLLYSYSTNAKKSFVSNKNYAYIFNHFYNQAAEAVVKEKTHGKPELYRAELSAEMDDINKHAIKSITDLSA